MNRTNKAVVPLPLAMELFSFVIFFMFPCKCGVDKGDESIVGVATESDIFDSGQCLKEIRPSVLFAYKRNRYGWTIEPLNAIIYYFSSPFSRIE